MSAPDSRTDAGFAGRPKRLLSAPSRPQALSLESLKIIVVGTPKTGNTWIKHLLAVLYELPIVPLGAEFACNDWVRLGPRWIGQQHYYPTADVLTWAQANGVIFIAPVRHPADVLVSLRHYVAKRHASETLNPIEPESMLRDGPGIYGEHTHAFLRHGFPLLLHLSIYWLRATRAHALRYEDLWRWPLETLRVLSAQIFPVSDQALRHAVCACEAELMRSTVDVEGGLVRKGGIGSWREELPEPTKMLLAAEEPYPDQFATLGYSMEESDPANQRLTEPAGVRNPFQGRDSFVNGVAISPILMRIYFDLPLVQSSAWPNATLVCDGSFFSWLRQPCEADPRAGLNAPVVTELAYALRSRRPDLQAAFADPFGADRVNFCHWFVFNAIHEFGFDRSFTLPVLASWARGSADPQGLGEFPDVPRAVHAARVEAVGADASL